MKHVQGPVFIQSGGRMKNVFGGEDGKVPNGSPVEGILLLHSIYLSNQ